MKHDFSDFIDMIGIGLLILLAGLGIGGCNKLCQEPVKVLTIKLDLTPILKKP